MENYQMSHKTTYKDLEEYFQKVLLEYPIVLGKSEMFIYEVGEYGAVIFHRCIMDFVKEKLISIATKPFLGGIEENSEQFVLYYLPNGRTLKLVIVEQYLEDTENREEESGFPIKSMLLKFKEKI